MLILRKKIVLILLILITLISFNGCNDNKSQNDDKNNEEIRQTALDYIEGWYGGDAQRMEKALHPNMVKRRFVNSNLNELDTNRMVASTKRGGGKDVPKDTYEIEVEILDVNDNIASVVTRSQYIDYLHLAKVNDEWVIVNVLWDFNREEK